jgi:hypothetical protein
LSNEGKSYCALHLASSLQKMGYSICLIDANLENPSTMYSSSKTLESLLAENATSKAVSFCNLNGINFKHVQDKIAKLKARFDYVLIDTSATAINVDAIDHIRNAALTLFINRINYTGINYLDYPDRLVETYNIQNTEILINDAMGNINYSGNYIGKRFRYKQQKLGLKNSLKYYFKNYFSL